MMAPRMQIPPRSDSFSRQDVEAMSAWLFVLAHQPTPFAEAQGVPADPGTDNASLPEPLRMPRFRIAEINIRRSLSTVMRHAYALTTNPTSAAAGGCRSDMPRHGLPTDRQTGQRVSR
jgi:hypothetical protein